MPRDFFLETEAIRTFVCTPVWLNRSGLGMYRYGSPFHYIQQRSSQLLPSTLDVDMISTDFVSLTTTPSDPPDDDVALSAERSVSPPSPPPPPPPPPPPSTHLPLPALPNAASQITPQLYLCDAHTATSPNVITSLGITHVVSVFGPALRFPSGIQTFHVPIEDLPWEDLLSHLHKATVWMEQALLTKEACVLVCIFYLCLFFFFFFPSSPSARAAEYQMRPLTLVSMSFLFGRRSISNAHLGTLLARHISQRKCGCRVFHQNAGHVCQRCCGICQVKTAHSSTQPGVFAPA